MKTLTEITNIIAKQIGEVAKTAATDYDIIVCPERIFMDDYLPKAESYLQTLGEMPPLDVAVPQEMPYQDTIFVVIKMGSGQSNMGVSNYSCTLQVLSEADDFIAARQLLDSFISKYNFEYVDGIVQSYFTPDMGGSQESVYTGFRALLSCRGNIRVPEDGVLFVTDVIVSIDGVNAFEFPYISVMYNHSCQPDPQAFAGTGGRTMALNRQSTQTITFDTYLWNKKAYDGTDGNYSKGLDWWLDLLSEKVIDAHSSMNRKFYLKVRTPISKRGLNSDGVNESGENLCVLSVTDDSTHSHKARYITKEIKEVTDIPKEVKEQGILYYFKQDSKYYVSKSTDGSFHPQDTHTVSSFENNLCIFDGWFILTNAAYNQPWGDISSWILTFTSCLKEEK